LSGPFGKASPAASDIKERHAGLQPNLAADKFELVLLGLVEGLNPVPEGAGIIHALVEHAMDGIVIIHDYKVRFANPAFCKLIGFSEKELIGAHLKKFISEEEFIKNTTRYSSRIAGLNLPRIYKSQVIHSDGSTIDVELNVSVVPYGRSLAALVFVRDIREEEAWRYCI
jgi:PAS domain S-box-containing protein